MMETEAATLFGALSNADRLKVIRTLVEAGPDGMNAGEIADKIGASPPRASFHLAALAESGLVTKERQSRSLIYRVNFLRVGGLVSFLLEDCCSGSHRLKKCCNL
ncbi:MAG: metalloregulator ArsR/SmtB family transcription factor [Roseobacter sp.]|uniref:ArsR/SmtB family transcription factor n=1 Tax=Roseibium sp. TaxID=1936156 RepID=UPI00326CE839